MFSFLSVLVTWYTQELVLDCTIRNWRKQGWSNNFFHDCSPLTYFAVSLSYKCLFSFFSRREEQSVIHRNFSLGLNKRWRSLQEYPHRYVCEQRWDVRAALLILYLNDKNLKYSQNVTLTSHTQIILNLDLITNHYSVITSAKEVMFSVALVCLPAR